jgi:hypothetical protein
LTKNLKHLDLSIIEWTSYILQDWLRDSRQTPCKNGGEAVGYQSRKASKTTNALFVSDSQWVVMLAMATPQQGQPHDLYEIQPLFEPICSLLKQAGINLKGLFLNTDSGFDSDGFQKACEKEQITANIKANPRNQANQPAQAYQQGTYIFDQELYQDRSVIEHVNAWIDGFKALLVRFEYLVKNWMSLHFIAFYLIVLRKINRKHKV